MWRRAGGHAREALRWSRLGEVLEAVGARRGGQVCARHGPVGGAVGAVRPGRRLGDGAPGVLHLGQESVGGRIVGSVLDRHGSREPRARVWRG